MPGVTVPINESAVGKPFQGKVITITGGARGIGLATARYLAERGATVCIADVLKADLLRAEDEIAKDFPDVSITHAVVDVTDSSAVDEWIKSMKEEFGKIDGCLNNAGIAGIFGEKIVDYTNEHWDKVINVNLRGIFYCLRAELKVIEKGGSIVNLSSVAGLRGFGGASAYVSSKFGIIGLTRTAAQEVAADGTRVNAVCPGLVDTQMVKDINETSELHAENIPQLFKRMAEPREIAALIAYLLGDESKFTTGVAYPIDGGFCS